MIYFAWTKPISQDTNQRWRKSKGKTEKSRRATKTTAPQLKRARLAVQSEQMRRRIW